MPADRLFLRDITVEISDIKTQKSSTSSIVIVNCRARQLRGLDQFESLLLLDVAQTATWDSLDDIAFPSSLRVLHVSVKLLDTRLLPRNLNEIEIHSDTSLDLVNPHEFPSTLKHLSINCQTLQQVPMCLPDLLETLEVYNVSSRLQFDPLPVSLKMLACEDCTLMETIDTYTIPRGLCLLKLSNCNQQPSFDPRGLPPGLLYLNLEQNSSMPEFALEQLPASFVSLDSHVYRGDINPSLVRIILLKQTFPNELNYFADHCSAYFSKFVAASCVFDRDCKLPKAYMFDKLEIPLLQAAIMILLASPSSLNRLPRELMMYLKTFVC